MMISEDALPRNGNLPPAQITKEGLGIANTAECKERSVADFAQTMKISRSTMTTKTQQARFRVEDRIFVRVACLDVRAPDLARHHEDVCTVARGGRFAEDSGGEQPLVVKFARTVEHHNVNITRERKVLETIVEKEHVDRLLLFDTLTLGKTIFADAKRDAAQQTVLHEFDFIACASRAVIATAQNCDALSFGQKCFCKPQDHGRLTSAANRQIADANHLAAQSPLLQPALPIEPSTSAD